MQYGPGVEKTIASAFNYLDLVVEPFHKATVFTGLEIFGGSPLVPVQGFGEAIKQCRLLFSMLEIQQLIFAHADFSVLWRFKLCVSFSA